MTLENTNEQFCALLAMLGDGVDVKSHAHWTGNWATAFSSDRSIFFYFFLFLFL